jgi:truncated hemoglobin YjbI
LKKQLVAFISYATGGPLKYTGKNMKDAHKGMGITDAEFDAAAAVLKKALEINEIKAEDIKAVLAAVEGTRKDIVETMPAAKPAASLWDRLGGDENVRKVVDEFVDLAAMNPKVNFDRNGKYKLDPSALAGLKKQLVAFLSQATGGPLKYEGKSMKDAHKGMGITDAEFNALAGDLRKALLRNAARTEDVDAVLKAVEETRKDIVEPK